MPRLPCSIGSIHDPIEPPCSIGSIHDPIEPTRQAFRPALTGVAAVRSRQGPGCNISFPLQISRPEKPSILYATT